MSVIEELVIKNRSYRSFDRQRIVTEEELRELVNCARRTPSAMNIQPLRYKLCTDEKDVAAILSLTAWAGRLRPLKFPPEGHEPNAFVVICADTKLVPNPEKACRDLGISAQTILLRAVEMGLGGCIIGSFSAEKLAQALSIDERYIPALVIAIGKPDEKAILAELEGDDTSYYRNEENTNVVPKRKLEDIII